MTDGYTGSNVTPLSIEELREVMDRIPKPPPSAIFLQSNLFDIMRSKPLEIESPTWDDETLPFRVRFTDMPIYIMPSVIPLYEGCGGPSCIDRSPRPYRPAITTGGKLVTATVACVLGLVVAFLAFGVQ